MKKLSMLLLLARIIPGKSYDLNNLMVPALLVSPDRYSFLIIFGTNNIWRCRQHPLSLGALFCTNSRSSPVPSSGYLLSASNVSEDVEKEFLERRLQVWSPKLGEKDIAKKKHIWKKTWNKTFCCWGQDRADKWFWNWGPRCLAWCATSVSNWLKRNQHVPKKCRQTFIIFSGSFLS